MTQRMNSAEFRATLNKPTATPAAVGSVAPYKPTTKRKGPSPANTLTKALLSLLSLEGCQVWRQNNGGQYDPTRQVFRAGSATPGISDILGYERATGRFVAVEVKVGADKLSPEQSLFLDNVRAAGGFACCGRSVEQVRREFIAWKQSLLL